jgi:DNA repair protein RadC
MMMSPTATTNQAIRSYALQLPIDYPKGHAFGQRVAEIQLTYRNDVHPKERAKVSNTYEMAELFRSNWSAETIELREEFKVAIFNHANQVLGICSLSQGGVSGTVVDLRLILITALRINGTGISIAHNHPTGSLKPSGSDLETTKKLKAACQLMDIKLLDHIILTRHGYTSLADEGEV